MSPTADELKFLYEAAEFFENPGKVAKGLAWAGRPVEAVHNRLPSAVKSAISTATEAAIKKAFIAAVRTIPDSEVPLKDRETASQHSTKTHIALTTVTGVLGGIFGLPALAIELPITTVLILRAISDQARLYGHDLSDLETRLECLMIFTMGVPDETQLTKDGRPQLDESGARRSIALYFATRASFIAVMRRAATTVGTLGAKELLSSVEKGSTPILVKLLSGIAGKFQVRVSQKFLAESLPLVGAIGGGALNFAFTDFFATAARYHFGIRALEKKYGEASIQKYLQTGN